MQEYRPNYLASSSESTRLFQAERQEEAANDRLLRQAGGGRRMGPSSFDRVAARVAAQTA
jgi:hypothetical protein